MQRHIYLDYAATTPIDPRVWEAMSEVAAHDWGNPSSIHRYGRAAKKHVERARERVAELIGAQEDEIYFTSGGTEADNLAVIGTALRWLEDNDHGCIITTPIEHSAVLHACRQLERKTPIEVEYAQVDRQGVVSLETLQASTVKHGFLMSVMLANNEVGTIQPVQQLAEYARERGWIVHTDAVQAIGQIEVNVQQLGVDLLSLSAHKFYGPKGIGALYVRRGTRLYSMLQGGAQEKRLRPGTENVPGIVGLGKAAELAKQELTQRKGQLERLREQFWNLLSEAIPDVQLNGAPFTERLPNNVNVRFPGLPGEQLLQQLDLNGIAASSGSACSAGSIESSHVLLAIGLTDAEAQSSLRFTFGKHLTDELIIEAVRRIVRVIDKLRARNSARSGKEE